MSHSVDSQFPPELRERLLDSIRNYLPAFLRSGASERHDPAGDVRELLNLEPGDLEQVLSVHRCLDDRVLAFGDSLGSGLRHPIGSSDRRREARQSVRGPVDWSATVAARSLVGGDRSLFVTRGASRVFDTPENRVLVWLLDRLRGSAKLALSELGRSSTPGSWTERIRVLSRQVRAARQVEWLRGLEPEAPTTRTMRRLQASRGSSFYADKVLPALRAVLDLDHQSSDTLAEALSRRYFEPGENWLVFEVYVALSLARAFAEASGRPRRTRLLIGSGRAAYASYELDDGSEVSLIYQSWPPQSGSSYREEVCARHGLTVRPKRPDIFIVRGEPDPDVVVLELKASFNPGTLVEGLSQMLGYMAEKPAAWGGPPSGWLVAPDPTKFDAHVAVDDEPLWMVGADAVAAAAVDRFVPGDAD